MRAALTAGIWIAALASLTLGGLIAVEFIFMATSLDPTEIVSGGTEPWTDALTAAVAFAGLAVATALGLTLWHTARFKVAGLILTIAEVVGVAWACAKVYKDYF